MNLDTEPSSISSELHLQTSVSFFTILIFCPSTSCKVYWCKIFGDFFLIYTILILFHDISPFLLFRLRFIDVFWRKISYWIYPFDRAHLYFCIHKCVPLIGEKIGTFIEDLCITGWRNPHSFWVKPFSRHVCFILVLWNKKGYLCLFYPGPLPRKEVMNWQFRINNICRIEN